jgi:hypothetical protein
MARSPAGLTTFFGHSVQSRNAVPGAREIPGLSIGRVEHRHEWRVPEQSGKRGERTNALRNVRWLCGGTRKQRAARALKLGTDNSALRRTRLSFSQAAGT